MRGSPEQQTDTGWDEFIAQLYDLGEFDIDLGLAPIERALQLEGNPQTSHDAILVAGTNGKGETAAFLSSILQSHGLTVGLYTSPHIVELRERFRVDGVPLSRREVLAVGVPILERYGARTTGGDTPQLSFFEVTTLMAACAFAQRRVDVAVYEVGLGGRLDATNALDPRASVVTSLALDHTAYLGETLEEIAREKAGVFRTGRPAIIGRQADTHRLELLESLAPAECAVYGRDFAVRDNEQIDLGSAKLWWRPACMAPTRMWNAACAAKTAACYLAGDFDESAATEGLERTRWPGRLELRRLSDPGGGKPTRTRTYLFDAAHNEQAARQLFSFIEQNDIELGAIVVSAMKDKELSGIFAPVPHDVPVFGAVLDSPRGATSEQLNEALGPRVRSAAPTLQALRDAWQALEASGKPEATILVYGSIYLLGETFEALGIDTDQLRTRSN